MYNNDEILLETNENRDFKNEMSKLRNLKLHFFSKNIIFIN